MDQDQFIDYYTKYLSKKQRKKFVNRLNYLLIKTFYDGYQESIERAKEQRIDWHALFPTTLSIDSIPTLSEILNKNTPNE